MEKISNFFGVVLVVLFCLFFISFPAAEAAQKALLIGVGTYKHLPYITSKGEKLDNLRGPANDVQKIKDMLVSGYNFSPDNILVLKDQEATREAILTNFKKWLVKETRPGDLVLFYYSGHGTRVPNGTKGFFKAFCPHDALLKAKDVQSANLILDDEIGDLLRKLKGREVVVIVDSCHSGGMTRSIRGVSVIQLEQTPAIQVKFLPVEITDGDASEKTDGRGVSLSTPKPYNDSGDRISLASSREDQMSVEMAFPSGMTHGAFTAALLEGIEKKKDISYGEWFDYAKKTIKDKFRLEQDPQIKTNKGKLLTHTVFKSFLIEPTSTEGQASSEEQSTRPTSIKPFSKSKPKSTPQKHRPSAPSQTATVSPKSQTFTQTSSGPSFNEDKEVKVLVRLDPILGSSPEELEILQNKLMEVPHVELVNTAFFDYLIRGEFTNNQYNIRLVTPMGDGEKVHPSGNLDDLMKRITSHLEYTYLLKKLARINNPHPPFKVKVQMKDKERRNFKVGEKARFFVSSDKDCYLIMLNLDSQGSMRIMFPNQYFQDNFIKAGQVIKIPDEKMGRKFELEFGEPVGEEVVKVIASTQPLKLEDLSLGKLDVRQFGPQGLITVPGNQRGILIKQVEKIQDEKMDWSEDTIIIRTHK